MNKKIKLSKGIMTDKSHTNKSKLINSILFILIFLLTVSTMITIQIRSDKNNATHNSAETTLNIADENIAYREQEVHFESYDNVYEQINKQSEQAIIEKFVLPYHGEIIKSFSDTELIYSKTMDDWRIHCGLDIKVATNSEIVCMFSGKVCDIIKDDIYGTTIVIDHKDAVVKYCNIDVYDKFKIGTDVTGGEPLGIVLTNPMCEAADALHIHIEAYKNNVVINPLDLIQ